MEAERRSRARSNRFLGNRDGVNVDSSLPRQITDDVRIRRAVWMNVVNRTLEGNCEGVVLPLPFASDGNRRGDRVTGI